MTENEKLLIVVGLVAGALLVSLINLLTGTLGWQLEEKFHNEAVKVGHAHWAVISNDFREPSIKFEWNVITNK